jgi:hypothetical protein
MPDVRATGSKSLVLQTFVRDNIWMAELRPTPLASMLKNFYFRKWRRGRTSYSVGRRQAFQAWLKILQQGWIGSELTHKY